MSTNPATPSRSRDTTAPANEPITTRDRIVGLAFGLALSAFGAATWLWPSLLSSDGESPSGRSGRKVAFWLDILWSRPAGVIAILLGLLVLAGVLLRRNSPKTTV